MTLKSNENVLLIGGYGFIGTALTGHLIEKGFNVHVADQSASHPDPIPRATYFSGNLADEAFMRPLLDQCGTIVHLATTTTPGLSADQAAIEAETNILPTLRLIDILRDVAPRHLLFVSSGGTLYGNPASRKVSETAAIQPLSFHGAGKAALEYFFKVCAHTTRHTVTILRPSNIYGPGQPLKEGFGVIRTMLEHLLHGTAMDIWGDGSIIRDYLFITDMLTAVSGIIDGKSHPGGTYNVGVGVGHRIDEVIAAVQHVTGERLSVRYHSQRIIDVQNIVLNHSKLAARTGWQPQVPLDEGIRQTWAWLTK